ncbi:hypothetical protein HF675_08320 [Serratia sp. JUb9]|uniref:hypothetical protein n=1 Tax=Enterobacterales TaxID=91347 RepID=UPI000D30132E|nr:MULTISPECIES: hypothetical protein [Enterobacterales]HDV8763274.1 hypothetical protein [Raoultella ornithinolytica]MBE4831781.1 hypothetical protein [Enterobacter cloacae complex sp. P47BA]QNK34031.1 hypothetical protein HF675_08320 [Serratia sp. JUb9]RYJ12173.1 hypothetical protein C5Y41_22050 [Rahnella variigena]GJK72706.1 hypothetical protein TUM17564_47330 [Citrobacter freundii]
MAKYAGMTDDELADEIARLKAEIEIRDEYFRDAEDDVIVSTIVQSTIDLLFKEWEAAADEKSRWAGYPCSLK